MSRQKSVYEVIHARTRKVLSGHRTRGPRWAHGAWSNGPWTGAARWYYSQVDRRVALVAISAAQRAANPNVLRASRPERH